MGDSVRRAILTDREREILSGEADVSDQYRWEVVSRVRRRIKQRLPDDLDVMDAYGQLGDDLREVAGIEGSGGGYTLEEALEQLIDLGRAAPLCPDCKQRLSTDPEKTHDCPVS